MSKEKNKKIFSFLDKLIHNSYIGFNQRVVICFVAIIILFVSSVSIFKNSYTIDGERSFSYKEGSSLDYKVYLLPNEFYDKEYLDKNMIYVASLIKNIDVTFDYRFNIDTMLDMDFTYNILADLQITNVDGTKTFFEKQYTLLEPQHLNMRNNNFQKIEESIKIDYSKYNNIANSFKASYGVDTESKLTVYMAINKQNTQDSDYTLNDNKNMSLTIPLSQKAVDIKMQYNEIDNTNRLFVSSKKFINNYFTFIISIILFVLGIILTIGLIKLLLSVIDKRSKYDIYLNKILKEYDRLIAESNTLPSFDDKSVIKLNKFTELLDVHDNLQLPIIHYTIAKHHKCYFYISHNETIYLFVLKAIDLEVSKHEKAK